MMVSPASPLAPWDIFCQVIDNYGDIGVCWRLAAALAAQGRPVRLRVDDASALAWMAPHGAAGVQVLPYNSPWDAQHPPQAVIEGFGCNAPAHFLAAMAAMATQPQTLQMPQTPPMPLPVLVNLEYLSAEDYVGRSHGLPSPLLHGAGQGLTRWFFYPGFRANTGGLLREPSLTSRIESETSKVGEVSETSQLRSTWRKRHGWGEQAPIFSLFCYELPALKPWLADLAEHWPQAHIWVSAGRASQAVRQAQLSQLPQLHYAEHCSQSAFDEMLCSCDLNLVRGEDSLVRALWAGQALVWHIYPQEDDAHHAKLEAFLDWLQAPPRLRQFHYAWNGLSAASELPRLSSADLVQWRECVQAARQRLLAQTDLLQQLQAFVQEKWVA